MRDVPPFPAGRKLKVLRVVPDAAGELHTFRDAADHDPENYWFDLLHDPRARIPSGPGYWRSLAANRDKALEISCDRCAMIRHHAVNDLIDRFGGAMQAGEAAVRLAACSKSAKRCQMTWRIPKDR